VPNTAQTAIYEWDTFGNGCPNNYAYNIASTCIYTGRANTMSWYCTFKPSTTLTSTVFGGTTTFGSQGTATVTAPIQGVTVTQTQHTTRTSTSVVDPGAHTVTVTSTQGAQRRRSQHPIDKVEPGIPAVFDLDLDIWNSTHVLGRRFVCPYTSDIFCGTKCSKFRSLRFHGSY